MMNTPDEQWELEEELEIPQQSNPADSGVMCLLNALYTLQGTDPGYEPEQMSFFRRRMAVELVAGNINQFDFHYSPDQEPDDSMGMSLLITFKSICRF